MRNTLPLRAQYFAFACAAYGLYVRKQFSPFYPFGCARQSHAFSNPLDAIICR